MFEECIDTANFIVDYIKEHTGKDVKLDKIGESQNKEDLYIKYKMIIDDKRYELYAGEEDYTIVGIDDDTFIESTGFNNRLNLEDFCDSLEESTLIVDRNIKLDEAIETLRKAGYLLEDTDTHEETFDYERSLENKIKQAKFFNKEGKGKIKTIADLVEYAKSKGFKGKIFNKYSGIIEFSKDPDDALIIDYDSYYANEGGWEVYWAGATGDGFDTIDEVVAYVKPQIDKWKQWKR